MKLFWILFIFKILATVAAIMIICWGIVHLSGRVQKKGLKNMIEDVWEGEQEEPNPQINYE